jgi:hypothetical protein
MTGPIAEGEPNGFASTVGSPISVVIPGAEQPVVLCPELVDMITEAVAMPDTAAARAEVIAAMLLRALDAVSWRQGLLGDGREEASLLRVVRAAEAHRQRMTMTPDRLL